MDRSPKHRITRTVCYIFHVALMLCMIGGAPEAVSAQSAERALQIDVFRADDDSFGVTATLIYGGSEAFLVDSECHRGHFWWDAGRSGLKRARNVERN